MIQQFVDAFMEKKGTLEDKYGWEHPENYLSIVKDVAGLLPDMDPERVTEIDHGDYQGTLVYVIGAEGYQPHDFWFVLVGYGSCSGCDTLEEIKSEHYGPPEPQQTADYMTLALHIVQGLKHMGDEVV